jgi:hypothetical protein
MIRTKFETTSKPADNAVDIKLSKLFYDPQQASLKEVTHGCTKE